MSTTDKIPPIPDALRVAGQVYEASGGQVVDPAQLPDWQMKLAALAKQTVASERPPGQFFSTKSGILSFNKIPLNGNQFNGIITAAMFENVFYMEKFNAEKISAPTCYAFAIGTDEGMAPHQQAHKAQAPTCAVCPNFKWGSDPGGGKGKACKQMRRLAVIPATGTDAEAIRKATVGFIRVPVTSTKEWANYVRTLAQSGRTPLTVVTNIALVPDAKTMHRFLFTFVSDIAEPELQEALVRRNEFDTLDIQAPYPNKEENGTVAAAPTPPAASTPSMF